MNSKVSVIVPVYNAEKYLKSCLDSILNQTYQEIEVICINDGSRDSSLEIINNRKEQDSRIHVQSIPNGGQANARNVGIDLCSGDYLCFVDSDDTLEKDMIENMVESMEENNSDIVVCGIDRIFEGGVSFLEKKFNYDPRIDFVGTTTIYEHPEIICYLKPAPFAKLIRKEFLDHNQIRFVKGYIYEDLVFTQTLLSCNPTITLRQEKYYRYLVRNNSTMTSKKSKVTDMFVSYKNLYDSYEKQKRCKNFKEELDYLCLYHVMIGTSYRMWRSKQYGLWQSIKECRAYVKAYDCQKKNKYVKTSGIVNRIFLKSVL